MLALSVALLGACTATETAPHAATKNADAPAADAPVVTVYKSPFCGCCHKWVDHMKENGFQVEEVAVDNMNEKRADLGVPTDAASCHTAVVDGYVLEGHVPADDIKRLLAERPEAHGLAVPGMPLGSPGMEHPTDKQPYDTWLLYADGSHGVFASH